MPELIEHTRESAIKLATELIEEYGLDGWRFCIDKDAKSMDRLGLCVYSTKTISVSAWVFTDLNEEVEDTIRHELAHAIVGKGHEHGLKWKATARNVGAKPRACCHDGIPYDLRIKVKERRDAKDPKPEPKPSTYNYKPFEPISYQLPVILDKTEAATCGFTAMHGTQVVSTNEQLTVCIAEAVAYCSERRAALVINFQKFVKSSIPTPINN